MIHPGKNLCETRIIGPQVRQSGIHSAQCPALLERGIYSVGVAVVRGRYCVVRLNPDFEHLTVCCGGQGQSLIGGRWVPWREGEIVFSPHGVPHGSRSLPRQVPWVLAWITFTNRENAARRIPFERATLLRAGRRPLDTLVRGLEAESVAAGDPVSLFHWVELIARFAERALRHKPGDHRLALLWRRVQERIGDNWTVTRLAREAGVSGAHLRRLCRDELGFGPNRQLVRLRLKHASLLLMQTAQSIEQIAYAVGYSDAFAFSTAFRRHMGVSPRGFRRPARV